MMFIKPKRNSFNLHLYRYIKEKKLSWWHAQLLILTYLEYDIHRWCTVVITTMNRKNINVIDQLEICLHCDALFFDIIVILV